MQIVFVCFLFLIESLQLFEKKIVNTVKSRAVVSSTFKGFQTVYEGKIWSICTVTFGQKSSKLNSRPIYCSRLDGKISAFLHLWKNRAQNGRSDSTPRKLTLWKGQKRISVSVSKWRRNKYKQHFPMGPSHVDYVWFVNQPADK